ncbi:MAG: heparan-alpha-glucosaminide N-acetyltransferase domain-containing protein [Crocinitomicaceae bacterium]
MEQKKKQRIVFLDLMRFLALFMMIQGHTIYAFLNKDILDGESVGIGVWRFFRGYTAPFFMVIAGAVFTFLLIQDKPKKGLNPRIKKGLIRVVTLFFWGYVLRFPIQFFTRRLSQAQIDIALGFDVLQLIGFGLLIIILIFSIIGIQRAYLMTTYLILFLVVAFASPFIETINFHTSLPKFFSMWLNDYPTAAGKASLFPIFPWVSYLLFGGFFGAWLSFQSKKHNFQKNIDIKLLIISVLLYAMARIGDWWETAHYGVSHYWGTLGANELPIWGQSENLLFDRIAFVIFIGSIFAFVARFVDKLPKLMGQMSRNTLWLYVGHLVILYWIRPIFSHRRYDMTGTLICVVIMFGLMILQTKIIENKHKAGTWKNYFQGIIRGFKKKKVES